MTRFFLVFAILLLSGCDWTGSSPASRVYDSLIGDMTAYVTALYRPLTDSFGFIAQQLMVVFLVVTGWAFATNRPKPFIINFAIASFVAALVGTNIFLEWIYHPITGTARDLAEWPIQTILSDSSSQNVFATMEQNFLNMGTKTAKLLDAYYVLDAEFWGIIMTFGLLVILMCVQYVMFLGLMLIGIIGLGILMVPAGVMLWLAATPFTRHIFFAWLRLAMTYALIPFFSALVVAFSLKIISAATKEALSAKLDKSFATPEMAYAAIVVGISIWLMSKAPEWAASVTGGQSTGMGGLMGMAIAGSAAVMAASKAAGADAEKLGGQGKKLGEYGFGGLKGGIDGMRTSPEGMSKPYSTALGIIDGVKETYQKRNKN